jgi:IS5 family transposase
MDVSSTSTMPQSTFEKYGRKSRRELFLEEMQQVVPWSALEALVEPHYPKAGNGLSRWACGSTSCSSGSTTRTLGWKGIIRSPVSRRFVGVDLGISAAPDETTGCLFPHLLEKHDLGDLIFS